MAPKKGRRAEALSSRIRFLVQAMLHSGSDDSTSSSTCMHGQTFHARVARCWIPIVLVIVALRVGCFCVDTFITELSSVTGTARSSA